MCFYTQLDAASPPVCQDLLRGPHVGLLYLPRVHVTLTTHTKYTLYTFYTTSVKSFYFMSTKFRGLMMMDMLVDT